MPFIAKNGSSFDVVDEFSFAQYDPVRFDFYVNQLDTIIHDITLANNNEYPNMKKWYDKNYSRTMESVNNSLYEPRLEKRIEEVRSRPFFLVINPKTLDIAALCLMKNTVQEQKICTLFVLPTYRNIGIGSKLLQLVSETLRDKPFIQISENTFKKHPQFAIILARHGYKFTARENTYERVNNDELYYTFKKKWFFLP